MEAQSDKELSSEAIMVRDALIECGFSFFFWLWVLRLKGIEALKDVSDGRATKIFLPSDISSSVSSLLAAGEALGIGDAAPVDKNPKPKEKAETDPCIRETTSEEGKKAAKTTIDIKDEVAEQYIDPDHDSDKKKSRRPFGDAWVDSM